MCGCVKGTGEGVRGGDRGRCARCRWVSGEERRCVEVRMYRGGGVDMGVGCVAIENVLLSVG